MTVRRSESKSGDGKLNVHQLGLFSGAFPVFVACLFNYFLSA